MALYDELDAIFRNHQHFYKLGVSDMSEALDKSARLIGENAQVITYNGQIYLASQMHLGSDVTWATPVDGNPTE